MNLPLRVERHIAAVTARLRDATTLPVDVGVAPSGPPPYLVVHPDAGMVARARLSGPHAALAVRFDVEAVGAGPEQALWALDKARAALVDHRLDVEGAVVSPLSQTDGSSLRRDEVTQPPIYMIDAELQAFSQALLSDEPPEGPVPEDEL